MIQLKAYTPSYQKHIEAYQLLEEHQRFTELPTVCVQKTKDDSQRFSVLTISDEQLVTFFSLSVGDAVQIYTENSNAILLRSFSTDSNYQGRGYAKQSLMALPFYLEKHFPNITEIILLVNCLNHPAIKLYQACGFKDTTQRIRGIKGKQMVYSRKMVHKIEGGS
ncbi:MAG TPA: GNAT family N-acetyltransferase [Brochothrix thermosphacta]|nr:GNAT family N-acetyltransferase [Brochothrix thermosphacta]HCZ47278.1 GNAT family N-acetyltransferase [Brochothrix thermosphacta]